MVSRWMLRLFGLTLTVICLCTGLLPLQRVNAESVCYIEGCPNGQPPVITDQPDDVTISYKGTATFSVTATDTGTLSYQWYQKSIYGDEQDLWYAQTSTFTSTQLRVSTQFRVRVLNQYGYTDSDPVVAYINHVTDSSNFCTSQQLSLELVYLPQSDGRYVAWITDHGKLYVHDSETDTTTFITENAQGRPAVENGHLAWTSPEGTTFVDLHTSATAFYSDNKWPYLSDQYVVMSNGSNLKIIDLSSGTSTEVYVGDFGYQPILTMSNRYVVGELYSTPKQLYVYDLALGIISYFEADPYAFSEFYNPSYVQIAGSYVVWTDSQTTDVHLLDLTTQQVKNLSNTPDIADADVDLNGKQIVWWSHDYNTQDYRAYLYDIHTDTKTDLSMGDGRDHYQPRINGNRVAWASTSEIYDLTDSQVHVLDLETQSQQIIPDSTYASEIQMNDRWIVWQGEDGLYLYDGIATHQITASTTLDVGGLQLVGNLLYWRGAPKERGFIEYERTWHPFMADCRGAAPTITDQPDHMLISTGESVTLSVTATGDGSTAYQWYQGTSGDTSNLIPGATASSYTTPPLTTLTNYWVRVNGTFGTVDSDTASIVNRDEWTPTWTPVPPTATETLMPTATWTPQLDTETPMPSATWTDIPPTEATIVPSATTAPVVSLVVNGSFETDSDNDKLPDGWTAKKTNADKADKLKCDKDDKIIAHSAPCAFVFSGNPDGSTSTLSQQIDPAALYDGAVLTLSAWVDPKSAPSGVKFAQVKVAYTDGSSTKLKLSLPDGNGYIRQTDTTTLDLTGRTVKSAKIDLKYDQPGGKFYIDDVTLTTSPNTALFALP